MGENGKRRGDFWAHLLADIVVRIAFFVAAFVVVLGGTARGLRLYSRGMANYNEDLYAALVLGTLAVLFGPWLYRTATHRGRGTLSQVKKDSEKRK